MPASRASSIAVSAARAITRWPMPLSPSTSAVAAAVFSTRMSGFGLTPPPRSRLMYCGSRNTPWASAPVRSASSISSAHLAASAAGSPIALNASAISAAMVEAGTRDEVLT